jgi:hypothetical protein
MIGDVTFVFPLINVLLFYLLTRMLHSYSRKICWRCCYAESLANSLFWPSSRTPLILLAKSYKNFRYSFVAVCRLCPLQVKLLSLFSGSRCPRFCYGITMEKHKADVIVELSSLSLLFNTGRTFECRFWAVRSLYLCSQPIRNVFRFYLKTIMIF